MNKNKVFYPFTLFLLILFIYSCHVNEVDKINHATENTWDNLIDIELTNWDKYLSFKHQVDYDGSPPMDESNKKIDPI